MARTVAQAACRTPGANVTPELATRRVGERPDRMVRMLVRGMVGLAIVVGGDGCGRIGFDEQTPAPVLLTCRDAVLADAPVGYWRLGDPGGVGVARDETGRADGSYLGACEH